MVADKTQKIKVLVIDDSSMIRIAAFRMFGSNEFDVLLAVNGKDGLNTIENDPNIQVVFTDLVMPEMDGFEFLKSIRAHSDEAINNLPVIVMTSAENPELAKQKAFSIGATDFISKPFQATDLLARARSYAQFNQTAKTLKQNTTIDELTGTLNSKGLHGQLQKEITFVSRYKYHMSMMVVEVDNYKRIFISMGRKNTETIIQRIGKTLTESTRKEDSVARLGLARFAVSMPLVIKENAMEIANKICQTVESYKVKLSGKRLPLTVSTGIVCFDPDDTILPDMVIEMAEEALIKAQALGFSQLYVLTMEDFHKKSHHEIGERISIDELLDQVSQGNDFAVANQLEAALRQLSPLLSLLSNEQKQRVLNYHNI